LIAEILRRNAVKRASNPPALSLVAPERDLAAELDLLCREQISRIVQEYLVLEVDALLERARYERGAKAYRNGLDDPRVITTAAGPITIRRPRVRGAKTESKILPKHVRRLPGVDRTMHQLWIEGLATRDLERTLRGLLGKSAPLSAPTVSRLNEKFMSEFDAWSARRLDDRAYVYLWADGIHLGAGPDDERRVLLVIIAADADGAKHLLALSDAMSESEESWMELFEDLKARGLHMPKLLIADGANGMWAAATKAFADTAQQRCWVHKIRNVLDKVPDKRRDAVHDELREAMMAPRETLARKRMESLACSLERDYPKAAACVREDIDRMLSFYRFPQTNWKSLRTTNPIESTFATVRLRTDAAKRLRTGKSATYLVFALIERISENWRRIDGHREIRNLLRRDLASSKAA
jgi:putative transposase